MRRRAIGLALTTALTLSLTPGGVRLTAAAAPAAAGHAVPQRDVELAAATGTPTQPQPPTGSPPMSATPATTATQEPSQTPTSTPTAYPSEADEHEPNDGPRRAEPVGVGTVLHGLTLHDGDEDWYAVRLVGGRDYVFEARLTGGGDPRLRLFDAAGTTLVADAGDGGPGVPSPRIRFHAPATHVALLAVTSEVPHLLCQYELLVLELMPTAIPPTATARPTATPSDVYEPNGSFGTATALAVGYQLRAALGPRDNDLYKLYVESGVTYRCRVVPRGNLDTNLIVYDRHRAGVGGNNNAEPRSPASAITWAAGYEGWTYLLVGSVAGEGPYDLHCTVPGPAAQASRAAADTDNPKPTATRRTVIIPTPTGGPWARDRRMMPSPTTGPSPGPPIRVVAYYDENDNGAPDPAEGIVGGRVLLLDVSANKAVDWAETDRYGAASLRPPTDTASAWSLRVSVPFLGFSRRAAPGDQIKVEVEAQKLPGLIP